MNPCIIVFAKNPVSHQVKTRLSPNISAENAALLYRAFLMDWCESLQEMPNIDLVIAYTPAGSLSDFQEMIGDDVIYIEQKGTELGSRLTSAIDWASKNGYDKILLVGSDSPSLPLSYITQAVDALESDDIIIGPSVDGGYYLIALSSKCLDTVVPLIFNDIAWSTQHVLLQTVERIQSVEIPFGLLPPWYDVDTYSDLNFLYTHITAMRYSGDIVRTNRTEKLLTELFSKEKQEWDN